MTAPPSLPSPAPRPLARSLLVVWGWGWLALAQLLTSLLLAVPYLLVTALALGGLASLPALLVGLPVLALALALAMLTGVVERIRLEAFTGVRIEPARSRAQQPHLRGEPAWRRIALDTRPWRAVAHLTLIALWGLLAGTVTLVVTSVVLTCAAAPLYHARLPRGIFALPGGHAVDAGAWPWFTALGWAGLLVVPLAARGLVGLDIALARLLLGRGRREELRMLSERVATLTQTRTATVDSVEAERRRIERDLHDGPQQRLVAIAMDLGMAREKLDADPTGARELLDKAHRSAKDAIVEMRQVARGITPPILTDRGLDAALSALAARAPVPVVVRVDVPVRPSPTVEAIAYFCVSEALTNVAKHARARRAEVEVTGAGGALTVHVHDDGVGGADPARGTGLHGLRDRARAVDGTVTVTSPPGGPTDLTVVLPDLRLVTADPPRGDDPWAPPPEPPTPAQGRRRWWTAGRGATQPDPHPHAPTSGAVPRSTP